MCVNCSFSCFVFTIHHHGGPTHRLRHRNLGLKSYILIHDTNPFSFFIHYSSLLSQSSFFAKQKNNPIRLQAQVGQTTAALPSPPFVRRYNANSPIAVLLE